MAWQTTRPSLLERVRDPANEAAWAEFDRSYGELILRYCHRCGLQHSDAEDVRQIVLMSLASALRSFEYRPQRGRFRSYLGRVVRNAVTRHATRPDGRIPVLCMDETAADATDEPRDGQWEQEWVAHHLRQAMQTIRDCTKSLTKNIDDKAKIEETLRTIVRLEKAFMEAKSGTPEKAGKLEGKKLEKFMREYRTMNIAVLKTILDMEAAVVGRKLKKAKKLLNQVNAFKGKGHGKFQDGRGGRGGR